MRRITSCVSWPPGRKLLFLGLCLNISVLVVMFLTIKPKSRIRRARIYQERRHGHGNMNIQNNASLSLRTVSSLHYNKEIEREKPILNITVKRKVFTQQTENNLYTTLEKIPSCPEREEYNFKERKIPRDLYKLAPNVFDKFPTNFSEDIRSPCWRDSLKTDELHCLPSFFLAGVGKCGTTDLWDKVVKHPQIVRTVKEPRWWARQRLGVNLGSHLSKDDFWCPRGKCSSLPFNWYVHLFHELARTIQNGSAVEAKTLIAGDGSPSVSFDNTLWRDFVPETCTEGPTYVNGDLIRALLPNSKIVFILRNPATRFYSDYLFMGHASDITDKETIKQRFHEAVLRITSDFTSCLRTSSLRSCWYHFLPHVRTNPGFSSMVMLLKGIYSVYVREWLNIFPRNQLMFVKLEEWNKACEEVLPRIYDFLELDILDQNRTRAICHRQQKNSTGRKQRLGSMFNETLDILNEFYKSSRQELSYLLNDKKFLWED